MKNEYAWLTCLICESMCRMNISFFFFNDTATTEIYTLSLHDALPISQIVQRSLSDRNQDERRRGGNHEDRAHHGRRDRNADRKSTRLNSSHANISYAVFCLKKNK